MVALHRDEGQPLHAQLANQLRLAIQSGRLHAETRLPSSRALAADLGVSRGVVVEAYDQLGAEGYVHCLPRSSPRVARIGAGPEHVRTAAARPRAPLHDLRPGTPDLSLFPRGPWLAALRRRLREMPDSAFGYPDPIGPSELRSALADYLGRVRGVRATAEHIVVTAGVAQGIDLIARVLRSAGHTAIGVEDPGPAGIRRIFEAHGLDVVALRVDGGGLDVAALERAAIRAVVLTPAHQFPTGAVLGPDRRAALDRWVRDDPGRLLVEDDYDAEFRFDRAPVGTLQGLRPDRVIYVGSASKTLAPALRLGWIVAPAPLVAALRAGKQLTDLGAPTVDALAFADLLTSGGYDRHLRRARRRYAQRRTALIAALADHAPELTVGGAEAGLHLAAWLPSDLDEGAVAQACDDARIAVGGLSEHAVATPPRGALILGFAALPDTAARPAAAAIGRAVNVARADRHLE